MIGNEGGSEAATLPRGYFLPQYHTLADYNFKCLALENIVNQLTDEIKRRAFFTLCLGYPWSDTEIRPEHNPFLELYMTRSNTAAPTGEIELVDYTLPNVARSDIIDPRISAGNMPALLILKAASHSPAVSGRKANFILVPETAASKFRVKLGRLSENQLDELFRNIPAYPVALPRDQKIDVVVQQAVSAANAWIRSAVENHRPIYTGVSGHIVSYSYFFLSNAKKDCTRVDHPNLEQLRLTLLADLIGSNQHHSYDECMFSSHGLTHDGQTLRYNDRSGYRDIINSTDPIVRRVGNELTAAAIAIGRQVIASFDEHAAALDPPLLDWRGTVKDWYKTVIGGDFPGL